MMDASEELDRGDEVVPDPEPTFSRHRRLVLKSAAVAAFGSLLTIGGAGAKQGKNGGKAKNHPQPDAPPDDAVRAAGDPDHPGRGVNAANYYSNGFVAYDYHYGHTWFVYYYPSRVFIGYYNGFNWYDGYLRRKKKKKYVYVRAVYAAPYYGGIFIR